MGMYILLGFLAASLLWEGCWGSPAGKVENPVHEITETEGEPTPSDDSAQMVQREIDRRRESVFRLNELLDLADRLYQAGEWSHAKAKYQLVINGTQKEGGTAGFHRRAVVGKAKCFCAEALAKKDEGKISEAVGLMQQAAELDPENKALAKQARTFQEEATQQLNPYPGNPAATEALVQKNIRDQAVAFFG